MRRTQTYLLIILSCWAVQTQAGPLIDLARTVECTSVLEPLGVHHNSAVKSTRCYLVPNLLKCVPNLELKEDGYEQNDVCRNKAGVPVSMPICKTDKRFVYSQSIVQRRFLPVVKPGALDIKGTREWVDIPFSTRTVTAKLATTKPIHRRGPDMCVFRLLTKIIGMTQAERGHPKGHPAQYPVKKPKRPPAVGNR